MKTIKKLKWINIICLFTLISHSAINAQVRFLGSSKEGGTFDAGAIFSTNENGTDYTTEYNFSDMKARRGFYTKPLVASDNNIYFTTYAGGDILHGTIVKHDLNTDEITVIHSFTGNEGNFPYAGLTEVNGKLYGTTQGGGDYGGGTLYYYDIIADTLIVVFHFDGTNGRSSYGELTKFGNKLYGVTSEGGTNDYGVIFSYHTITGVFTTLYDFDDATGSSPYFAFEEVDGKLYSLTTSGGANGLGVLYSFDTLNNTYTVLADLTTPLGGYSDAGTFTRVNDKLYIPMATEGSAGFGTLLSYDLITTNITIEHTFTNGTDGGYPYGKLLNIDDILYGITYGGGSSNDGIIYRFNPSTGNITSLADFTGNITGSDNYGSLTFYNGKIYGVSNSGGITSNGVYYSYDTTSHQLNSITSLRYAKYGKSPVSDLLLYNNLYYGLTQQGGATNDGLIFSFNPQTSQYDTLSSFNGNNGSYPQTGLIEMNGKFYGVTNQGGTSDIGVIFEFDPSNNTISKLHEFNGSDGAYPICRLIALNGKLYGTTASGGSVAGTIFSYDLSTSTFTLEEDLDFSQGFLEPYTLTEENGIIYGVANYAFNYEAGALFSFDPSTSTASLLYEFTGGADGAVPNSEPIIINGILYGITKYAGNTGEGTLYAYDIANSTFSVFSDITTLINGNIDNRLIEHNNFLYGLSSYGGTDGNGGVFSVDLSNGNINLTYGFANGEAKSPEFGGLVTWCKTPTFQTINNSISTCENEFVELFSGNINGDSFQWNKDGNPISGAINDSLQFSTADMSDNGFYFCNITNVCGSNTSDTIFLTVHPTYYTLDTFHICTGDSIMLAGTYQTTAGTYITQYTGIFGCDSTFESTLYIDTLPNANVTTNGTTISAIFTGGNYQWIDCGNSSNISGETSQNYTATANGSYAVQVTNNSTGCTSTSTCINITTVSVDEILSDDSFSLYPNPSSGIVTLQLNENDGEYDLKILNATGEIVLSQMINTTSTKIDLSYLSAGVYYFRIANNNSSQVRRVTVVH